VKQLRAWSRADKEPPRVLDLRVVLERAATTAWVEIRHRARFTKEYRIAPPVFADELRLEHVFLVLLVNAAHAIPEGHPEAHEIRVVTTHDASGAAVVEVRDTGRGISPEDLETIFEPFSTSRPEEGAGLGLSIARSLVSGLGGRLEVESQVGIGTTFRVTLPPTIAVGSGEEVVGRGPQTLEPIARRRRAARVLIIDDEPLICGAVQRALSGEYQVTSFTSPRAALDHLAAGHHYDAILLDLMMPGMTGMQLYAELERFAPDQISRVILLTGGAFTPAATQFLHDTSHRRLDKPFDTRALQGVLAELVR
jgi:CheY-like chemotaxis protein